QMAARQDVERAAREQAGQLLARGRRHHWIPAADEHESWHLDVRQPRTGVEAEAELGFAPIRRDISARMLHVPREELWLKARAELAHHRRQPPGAVDAIRHARTEAAHHCEQALATAR